MFFLSLFLFFSSRCQSQALQHPYFSEAPAPTPPELFPYWPAKSEGNKLKARSSPPAPRGHHGAGGEQMASAADYDEDESAGYALPGGQMPAGYDLPGFAGMGAGFTLT